MTLSPRVMDDYVAPPGAQRLWRAGKRFRVRGRDLGGRSRGLNHPGIPASAEEAVSVLGFSVFYSFLWVGLIIQQLSFLFPLASRKFRVLANIDGNRSVKYSLKAFCLPECFVCLLFYSRQAMSRAVLA